MTQQAISIHPFRIGLTGGIASGKSTVAEKFSRLGARIIDADAISHELTQKNHPNVERIVHHFGDHFLTHEGELDRKKMREHISLDKEANLWLKNLLHPQIQAQLMTQSFSSTSSYCLLVIPLLAESTYDYQLDRICVVDCPESAQLERLVNRDHLCEQEAKRILHMQASRDQRLAIADDVILNNGDLPYLTQQIEDLHLWYLSLTLKQAS
jgi:dephospho-CoA kinase